MCPYYTHPFADVVQVEESAGCDTDLSNVDGCRFGTLSQSQMDIGSLQLKNVQYNGAFIHYRLFVPNQTLISHDVYCQ